MRCCSLLVAGLMVIAAHARAQGVPATISCNDRDGHAVTGVAVTNGVFAKASIDASGKSVVEYDARRVPGIRAQVHLFVYVHECGHLALGHDLHSAITTSQEHDADCYGIRLLMNKAGVTSDDVRTMQEDMQALGAGDARHLPWRTRTYDLAGCLPRPDSEQTAAPDPAHASDACVAHDDAANQVVSKSRDGRTINAIYAAANHCGHDVACTFTIEIGTLPDVDADAGSFARFHPQKTRSDQHLLKTGAEDGFRFQETVDAVPDGESTDFRVTEACR